MPRLNKVHMAGASKFARKLDVKKYSLADWRLLHNKSDIISVDILVGADYFYKIVNPVKPPILAYGMWLPYTIYGDVLLWGKFSGSAESKLSQGINYLKIQNIACVPNDHIKHCPARVTSP